MILYTAVPLSFVFAGEARPAAPKMEIRFGSACLEVESIGADRVRIVRLISPNPSDYLRPEYQPGRELSLYPGIP
ncbi:MAG: YlzJ-like family protein [Kyrpidia tusciae]|nr:YlzJ-like family protein [Kyrpidia tusciae]